MDPEVVVFQIFGAQIRYPETVWPELFCPILRRFSAESDSRDSRRLPGPAPRINLHGKSAPHAISNVLCPKLPSHTNPQAESNAPRKAREHQLVGRSALALRRPLCEDAYINVHARGESRLQTWTSIAGHPKHICIYIYICMDIYTLINALRPQLQQAITETYRGIGAES